MTTVLSYYALSAVSDRLTHSSILIHQLNFESLNTVLTMISLSYMVGQLTSHSLTFSPFLPFSPYMCAVYAEGRGQSRCLSLPLSTLFLWDRRSHWKWSFLLARLAGWQVWRILLLLTPGTGIAGESHKAWPFTWCFGSKLRSHAHVAGTLLEWAISLALTHVPVICSSLFISSDGFKKLFDTFYPQTSIL